MRPPYRAVLMDLGLLGLSQPDTRGGFNWNERACPYIPPNQMLDRGRAIDLQQAAVYALGAILYELITGHKPFPIQSPGQAAQYQNRLPAPPRIFAQALPVAVERVILTALENEPHKRFPTPGTFVTALASALAFALEPARLNNVPWDIDGEPLRRLLRARAGDTQELAGTLTLEPEVLRLAPGSAGNIKIMVINRRERVEHFEIELEETEIKSGWYTVRVLTDGRADVNQSAQFQLTLHPPAEARSGSYSVKVRAKSRIEFGKTVGEKQLMLVIERVALAQVAEILPAKVTSGKPASVMITNLGNARETFRLILRSEEDALDFAPAQGIVVLDPNQEDQFVFIPQARQRRWVGGSVTQKMTAQVIVLHASQVEQRKAEVRVPSHVSWFYLICMILLCIVAEFIFIAFHAPYIALVDEQSLGSSNTNQDRCHTLAQKLAGPGLAVCWDQVQSRHIKSLAFAPNPGLEIPITQTLGVITDTTSITNALTFTQIPTAPFLMYARLAPAIGSQLNNPKLIARNQLGELSFLGPLRWLGTTTKDLYYSQLLPAATSPAPQPSMKIARLCVAFDRPQVSPICSITDTQTFPMAEGQESSLMINWQITSTTKPKLMWKPVPAQIDEANATAKLTVPPAGDTVYQLSLVDETGQVRDTKLIRIRVTQTICMVADNINKTRGLALRESPGNNYRQLGVLHEGRVILLSAPVDYVQSGDAQSTDDAMMNKWIKIRVFDSGEEGWVVTSGLACAVPSPTPTLPSTTPGVSQTNILETVVPAGVTANAGETPLVNQTPTPELVIPERLPVQLPALQPTFGPTLTPTPTLTSTPTPTVAPTATPLPPPKVDIQVDKQTVAAGECFHVKWTITSVRAVYFDYGDKKKINAADLPSSMDNADHTIELCDRKRTTVFMWRIQYDALVDGKPQTIERVETRTVEVKNKPDE